MRPSLTPDDLLAPFVEAQKPRSRFRVGTEAEKFGLLADTLAPLPFEGERSVAAVLTHLRDSYGWFEEREHSQGEVISLRRGDASVTLEPAGQLELSGAPYASIHQSCAEFRGHLHELHGISSQLGIVWLSLGFHPFARHEELPHVPKLRYGVMETYLPTRGPRALDMMRRTCTVQANLDYESESDAIAKLRIALALQPIATAVFAHSPLIEGRVADNLCERAAVWLGMDPDRSGLLPFAWERDMSFQRYVQWALDAPMFVIKREDRLITNTRQSFRSFLEEGASGTTATRADWETHLNSLFPEARLKKTLEVRGVDAQPNDLVCAVPALWKGLLYDPTALSKAESLISPLDAATLNRARADIAKRALRATLLGKPVIRWAEELFDIAHGGLSRLAVLNRNGNDETVHLTRLKELLEHGKTPAELLLEKLKQRSDFARAVVEYTAA